MILATLVMFITLHGTNGQTFYINPRQITSIREPSGNDRNRFPNGTRCVVSTADGKFTPVKENCNEVHDMLR